jgi:hypothetical protein
MSRVSADGSSVTPVRSDSHPIWEVLWAKDGGGAVIVDTEFNQRFPPTGPMRWLPSDGSPALNLPANGSQAQWGSPAVPSDSSPALTDGDYANLIGQALADFGLQLSENGISDLIFQPLSLGDGRSLWIVHTVGLRDYSSQDHMVAVYEFSSGNWRQLSQFTFPDASDPETIPGPDYLAARSVQQRFIEPENGWLVVEGGIGAHGGTFHVLRFDGQSLSLEASNANGNPRAGLIEDINGDGHEEVLLDLTDFYIFSYAAGVRLINYEILRWDGSELVPVTLARLDNNSPAADLNNQAISLTEAELWKDARDVIGQARSQEPANETIQWNAAIIQTIAGARENANSSYPLMDRVFFGDYEAAVDMLRGYQPADLFSRQSPVIVGTSA